MPPPKTPAEEAARDRARRNAFFDVGAIPKGDRFINPQMKRTAYEFSEWARKQRTHHIQEGAYLDMLEREERLMGRSSYPEGHPRRERAISGRPPPLPPQARTKPSEARSEGFSPQDEIVRKATGDWTPIRPNRFAAPCDRGDGIVQPGEGRMERTATEWVTVHNHHFGPGGR